MGDESKNSINISKHGISFIEAKEVFKDRNRVILEDPLHSSLEKRKYCTGRTKKGEIATERYTLRKNKVRILGAGYFAKRKENV